MADIVERLRTTADNCEDMARWAVPELAPFMREVADEIERLRAAMDRSIQLEMLGDPFPSAVLIAALKESPHG